MVFTLASLPVVDLLPTIPLLSSAVVLIGIVTVIGFLTEKNRFRSSFLRFGAVHILGLFFILWMVLTNYQAAWFGVDRNWVLTFLQLWALVWLVGQLLDSPEKQHTFMWLFSIVSVISAFFVLQQGQLGDTISASVRALGLSGSPNATARYFVASMVFFIYLSNVTERRLFRFMAIAGAVLTFFGVFLTLSRTGILLLFIALGLQIIINTGRTFSLKALIIYAASGFALLFFYEQVENIIESIMPSILQGTDTIGLRYRLWQAAWQMWLDHPVQGVGIGMFARNVIYYAPAVASTYPVIGAHNTYLSILAETGLLGFGFFAGILMIAARNYVRNTPNDNIENVALRYVWLTVFLVVLIGHTTLNGSTDKLLWFLIGMSTYFPKENHLPGQTALAQNISSRRRL